MSGGGDSFAGEACRAETGVRTIDDVPRGRTFVEVFAVVIEGNKKNLYGAITIDDGLSTEELFRRDQSNARPVGPGELVELTGPARAVYCDGEVVMSIDLKAADDDEEVGSGQVVWNTYDTVETVYDKVEEYELEGVSGAITVRCAVVTNAVMATVAVELTTGGDEEKDVYGTLSAATAMFGTHNKVTLFSREREDAVAVHACVGIPLLRNVTVVPLDSSLEVHADLWDTSAGGQMVKGVAVFDASTMGTERKVIRGPAGEATVQVTWSAN